MTFSEGHTPADISPDFAVNGQSLCSRQCDPSTWRWGRSLGDLATPAQAKLPFLLNHNTPHPLLQSVSLTLFIAWRGNPWENFGNVLGLSFLL